MKPGRKFSSFTRQEVAQLFVRAQAKIRIPGFRILRAPTSSAYGKILIVIPRRVGNAPTRNLIRRRIKSIFREKKIYQFSYDFIIIVGPESAGISFAEIHRLLTTAAKCP